MRNLKNNCQIPCEFCALLKVAEKKPKLGDQRKNEKSLKLDDFRDVCARYGVEI